MKENKFKLYREENGEVLFDLEITRKGDLFEVIENKRGIHKENVTRERLNAAFTAMEIMEEQDEIIANVDNELVQLEVNEDIVEEFRDFYDFIGEVIERVGE